MCTITPFYIAALALLFAPDASPSITPARSFVFTYSATITDLPPGKELQVWLPVPPTDDEQTVEILRKDIPAKSTLSIESEYGNQILYAATKTSGEEFKLSIDYRVTRRRSTIEPNVAARPTLKRFLEADRLVPIGGRPLDLIKGKQLPNRDTAKARLLYDLVDEHMKYDKSGSGWGRGDAIWACENRRGNCTDFHSLFISLARSQNIPARFEIGFSIPEERPEGEVNGYHCWAKFYVAGIGWMPVDISEANKHPELRDFYFGNLSEDRVLFSVGRDLKLQPAQKGPPVNFFVYPYVEVGGVPYPAAKVKHNCRYKNIAESP
jgi:transglutaminase-like putative cysteine protease